MIAGVGVDIVEIGRVARAMENPRFLLRVFSGAERAAFDALGVRAESVAGAFAAKEAVSKALGTGMRGMGFRDIEILHDALGRPFAALSGGAKDRLGEIGGKRVHLSISHSRDHAVAQAIVEGSVSGEAEE